MVMQMPGLNVVRKHSVSKHTDVARRKFIAVPNPDTTLGAVIPVMQAAANVELNGIFSFEVPDDFVSFSALYVVWMSPAAAGNMRFGWNIYWSAAGESYTNDSEVEATEDIATGGANVRTESVHSAGPTFTGLAKGDSVQIRAFRDGDHASDTLDDVFNLYGIVFAYTAEQ